MSTARNVRHYLTPKQELASRVERLLDGRTTSQIALALRSQLGKQEQFYALFHKDWDTMTKNNLELVIAFLQET